MRGHAVEAARPRYSDGGIDILDAVKSKLDDYNAKLAEIEQKIGVQILRRGNQLAVFGEEATTQEAVEVLHLDDGRAFVRGTLAEGSRVVLGGTNRVIPGQRVAPAAGS